MHKEFLAGILRHCIVSALEPEIAQQIVRRIDFDKMVENFLTQYWRVDLADIPEEAGVFLAAAMVAENHQAVALVERGADEKVLLDAGDHTKSINSATHFSLVIPLP